MSTIPNTPGNPRSHPHHWGEAEIAFVRDAAQYLTDGEIAVRLTALLGRAVSSWDVNNIRKRNLGIKKAKGRGVCRITSTPPSGESPRQ